MKRLKNGKEAELLYIYIYFFMIEGALAGGASKSVQVSSCWKNNDLIAWHFLELSFFVLFLFFQEEVKWALACLHGSMRWLSICIQCLTHFLWHVRHVFWHLAL